MNKDRQIFIEKNAENLRYECNVADYGIKDIFECSDRLGYRTIRYPIGSEAFLGLALVRDSERIVFSNSSLILSREIFSVAHEIGHHRLHFLSEEGTSLIRDDDFSDRNEFEVEANFFAACLLMPLDKVIKFIRLELKNEDVNNWDGFDIARIQTVFHVSYDMALIRLKALDILNTELYEKLRMEKVEKTASKLLSVIGGNIDLCKASEAIKLPADYLEWVISNYNNKLIPYKSLETALKFVNLCVDDVDVREDSTDEDDESLDDLLKEMD